MGIIIRKDSVSFCKMIVQYLIYKKRQKENVDLLLRLRSKGIGKHLQVLTSKSPRHCVSIRAFTLTCYEILPISWNKN